jgi:protease-4
MSLETDLILDRRRLARRLIFWRTVAVLAVIAVVLTFLRPPVGGYDLRLPGFGFATASHPAGQAAVGGGSYVARLPVDGIIGDDPKLVAAVRAIAGDRGAAALIVTIDSPGGSVAGGEALHDAIAAVAAVMPVVGVLRGTPASAGYMIAVPAQRIFARQSTITGSIGVLLETGDVSGLLKMLGISADPIVSGPLKDQPSYVKPLSPQGRDVLQGLVMDLYDQFVGMVASGRHMDPARVRALADGRAYTGRQALPLGLIDAIGGEADARAWLASAKGVPADLPTSNVGDRPVYRRMLGAWFGGIDGGLWKTLFSQGVMLDRAMAIWQPGVQ